jgi:hypothetical protein
MLPLSVSYVLQVLPASRAPVRWEDLITPFWRKLLYPSRPELYYMGGPGPKWREKHLHKTARRSTDKLSRPTGRRWSVATRGGEIPCSTS